MPDVEVMKRILAALKDEGFTDSEILTDDPNVIGMTIGDEDFFLAVSEA